MRKIFYLLFVFIVIICFTVFSYSKKYITPTEAVNYIGQERTVCGVVASTKYASFSKGQPTFLNLDKPYPNHIFTVVIWGKDREKFDKPPETYYKGKKICVHGLISSYGDIPQIVVSDPLQITLMKWDLEDKIFPCHK